MAMDPKNPNTEKILAMIGKPLGTDPKVLQSQLEAGKYDALFQKMAPNDAARMQQLVNNPKLAQQLINTPQAKQVLQNFINQAEHSKYSRPRRGREEPETWTI